MSSRKNRIAVPLICLSLLVLASCAQKVAKTPPPFTPEIGVCTSNPNAEFVKTPAIDYIEPSVQGFLIPAKPDAEFAKNRQKMQNSPVNALACNGFIPGKLKSVGPEIKHDQIIEYSRTAFTRANQIGVKYIVFGSGASRRIPENFDPAQAKKQFIDLLTQMGPVAAEHGITVVIEPLRSAECNFINTVTEATKIARKVNHPNIAVLADFYHMMQENEGPASIIAAGPLLKHCHIAENQGRWYPGRNGEDFISYLEALKQIGYTGGISMECRWSDISAELPKAVDYLTSQITAVKDGSAN